jgi:hypothetical protein
VFDVPSGLIDEREVCRFVRLDGHREQDCQGQVATPWAQRRPAHPPHRGKPVTELIEDPVSTLDRDDDPFDHGGPVHEQHDGYAALWLAACSMVASEGEI